MKKPFSLKDKDGNKIYDSGLVQEEIEKREEIEAKYNALEARISALEGS